MIEPNPFSAALSPPDDRRQKLRLSPPAATSNWLALMYLLRYTPCRRRLRLDRPQPQKIPLIFFRTAAGREPVREWLKGSPAALLRRQKELEQ